MVVVVSLIGWQSICQVLPWYALLRLPGCIMRVAMDEGGVEEEEGLFLFPPRRCSDLSRPAGGTSGN